ncbi:MAG TPA: hypothetical protein VJ927_06790 [Actinomycetota bacterium]|nr:hypothetical protein [Actinomycetota bacterium]
MPYRLRTRRFLNVLGYNAGAYILAVVEDSSRHVKGKHGWPYAEIDLTIADCDRAVSFDFDLSTRGARRNSLRKIDIMIETLKAFRDALADEAAVVAARDRGGAT